MANADHDLGGASGGVLSIFAATGEGLLALLVGRRHAMRRTLGERSFAGAAILGFGGGLLIGAVVRGGVGAAMGCVIGMLVGGVVNSFLMSLVNDLDPAKRQQGAGPVGWQQELKKGGVSAHEIDEIENEFNPEKQANYFRFFRLSREDGQSVKDAHYSAFHDAKRGYKRQKYL
jgi:hypothetical protein